MYPLCCAAHSRNPDRHSRTEHEQWNRACTWVCGSLMALGARLPPTPPVFHDGTTVHSLLHHPFLDDFGQAAHSTNPSTRMVSPPPVPDIFPLHSSISGFGGNTPTFASVHSPSRNTNAGNGRHQAPKGKLYPYDYSLTLLNRRKARQPAASFEPNVIALQERLRREGGDEHAIALLERVFSGGVALDALTRRQTREEAAKQVFGQGGGGGPVYLAFLEILPLKEGDNGALGTRFRCCLCPSNAEALSWKHQRDVLRHLRRDHFGLGETCLQWYVYSLMCNILFRSLTFWLSGKQVYTKGEMSSHRCKISFF